MMIQLPEKMTEEHLRNNICKGDVLFWNNFPTKEGERDSYFVILTGCINDKFIAARATKRTYHYFGELAERLVHDIIFIKKGETIIFPKDSVIDLTWLYHFTVEQLSELYGSNITKKGTLPELIIKRLDSCVHEAITLSPRDKDLILHA